MTVRDVMRRMVEGEAIDWNAVEAAGKTAETLLRELRTIAAISQAHATLQSGTPPHCPAVRPTEWGPLRIVAHLGSGSFGDVYRAHDPHLGRDVALKLLRRDEASSAQLAVVREGHHLARVRHPNVVTVYGANRVDGQVGIWMELIRGTTLEHEVRADGALSPATVFDIGRQVCRGLAAVHQAGLVHGDVKAHNVMRDDTGRVVLMDLGAGRDLQSTTAGAHAGTPLYMAPELLNGGAVSVHSDIYSVGVLLYRLATTQYPFPGSTVDEIRTAQRRGRPRAADGLPGALRTVIVTALAADPRRRYGSAHEMGRALEHAEPGRRAAERYGRLRRLAPLAALVLLTTALLVHPLTQGARPATADGLHEHSTGILVVPFQSVADSSLDGAIERVLERELLASNYVQIVPRARVDDALLLMRRPVDAALTPELAREVAIRDGQVHLLLAGRVDRVGSAYIIHAALQDPHDGRTVAATQDVARHLTSVPDAIRRVGRRVRLALGEPRASIVKPRGGLQPVTTRSLRSLRLYSESYDLGERGQWGAALPLVREAVAEDPLFASAHTWLAWALLNTGASEAEYQEAAARALTLSASAAPWERHWIRGSFYSLAGQHESAIGEYRALIQLKPDMVWPYGNLATAYQTLGRGAAMPVDVITAGANLRPNNVRLNVAAMQALLAAGDRDRAAVYAERVRAAAAAAPVRGGLAIYRAVLLPSEDAWMQGDTPEAVRRLRVVESGTLFQTGPARDGFTFEIFWAYLRMGQVQESLRVAELFASPRDTHVYSAVAAFFGGDEAGVRSHLQRAWRGRDAGDAQWPVMAWLHTQLGDGREARIANARATMPTRVATQGHIALLEGRLDEAIAALSVDTRALGSGIDLRRQTALAATHARRGDLTAATTVLAPLEREAGEGTFTQPLFRMHALLHLARYYQMANRPARARRILDELRPLLRGAEDTFILRVQFESLEQSLDGFDASRMVPQTPSR